MVDFQPRSHVVTDGRDVLLFLSAVSTGVIVVPEAGMLCISPVKSPGIGRPVSGAVTAEAPPLPAQVCSAPETSARPFKAGDNPEITKAVAPHGAIPVD